MNIEPRRRILDSLPAHIVAAFALLTATCALAFTLAIERHLAGLIVALVILVPLTAYVYSRAVDRIVDAANDALDRRRARKVRAGCGEDVDQRVDEWRTELLDVVDLDELPGRHALDSPTSTIPAVPR